jgi:YfiR/HmsC-like
MVADPSPRALERRPSVTVLMQLRAWVGCGWLLFSFTPGMALAQSPASKEYQLKAAFLFNFVQFVEWPSNTFANAEQPFRIGILGEDPFGKSLDETVQGESVQKRKLIIVRSRQLDDLQGCQVVFISKSEKGQMTEILAKLGALKMLTVSEVPGFANRGGVINFFVENNKVRFEINPTTAQSEGLKISSQLLSVGKIVETNHGKEER